MNAQPHAPVPRHRDPDPETFRDSTASPRRRRSLAAFVSAAALIAAPLTLLATPTLPAAASECSSKTGGNNHRVMWTGSGYTCAYVADSGKKKIGAWKTHSWTNSTALGYKKKAHRKKHTGDVDISTSEFNSDLGSSITFTAFNTASSSRHWGGNVLWHTPKGGHVNNDQFEGKKYEYRTNRFTVSKLSVSGATATTAGAPVPYSVKVTDPDGGTTPVGMVVLFRQIGNKPVPAATACDGTSTLGTSGVDGAVGQAALSNGTATLMAPPNLPPGTHRLYAVYTGSQASNNRPLHCAGPPNDGVTPAQSSSWELTVTEPAARAGAVAGVDLGAQSVDTAPRIVGESDDSTTPGFDPDHLVGDADGAAPMVVVQRRFTVGADRTSPRKNLACPTGYVPLQLNAASRTQVLPEQVVEGKAHRMRIRHGIAPAGTKIDVQVVCRPPTGKPIVDGKTVLGSVRGDRLVTGHKNSTVLAGAGNDTVKVTKRGSTAFGFTGRDHIIVTTKRAAANGGPGQDRLVARKGGNVLLVGGPGRDVLIGAKGKTLINAVDGQGGDHVICRSKKNKVLIDAGDIVEGPCQVVNR